MQYKWVPCRSAAPCLVRKLKAGDSDCGGSFVECHPCYYQSHHQICITPLLAIIVVAMVSSPFGCIVNVLTVLWGSDGGYLVAVTVVGVV